MAGTEGITREEELNNYDGFIEKFKPKLTTDDCFTPPSVYAAVKKWACDRYGIDHGMVVRPFFPGGDYEHYHYPSNCVVIDNPPFSILSKICKFYIKNGIDFFLFAPALTAFSSREVAAKINHIFTDSGIIYENGAKVKTAFVTSFGGNIAETAPDLGGAIERSQKNENKKQKKKHEYPSNLITGAMLSKYANAGFSISIPRECAAVVNQLDAQKAEGDKIFGCGLLVDSATAMKKDEAEDFLMNFQNRKNFREKHESSSLLRLSVREQEIVKNLSKK